MSCMRRALALGIFICLFAPSAASDPISGPSEGILVLRNGRVLSGRIEHVGDEYVVSLGEGSRLNISAAQVEFPCRDLEEAYRLKLTAMDRRNADQQLDLAEWCFRHGLFARAASQIRAARYLDPEIPRADRLERWLVRASRPTDHVPVAAPRERISHEDVEQAIRKIDPEAVATFSRTVQPLLLNRCAIGGCHGSNAQADFHLIRSPTGNSLSRILTQRNLLATLQWVDADNPHESPLLVLPRSPHGSAGKAIFTEQDQKQLDHLVAWVNAVVDPKPDDYPRSITKPNTILSQKGGRPPVLRQASAVTAPAAESAGDDDNTPASDSSTQSALPFAPRDPFDPEIFNRRFHADDPGAKR